MNTVWYVAILALYFAVQLVLSALARRTAVKCIPAILVLVQMVACFAAYALSGWTNWGWLIMLMLVTGALVPVAMGAVLGSIVRKLKNRGL